MLYGFNSLGLGVISAQNVPTLLRAMLFGHGKVDFRRPAPLPLYKELGMREVKKAGFALCVGMFVFILTGFGPKRSTTVSGGGDTEAFARHISMLRTGKPQQKAAARTGWDNSIPLPRAPLIHSWNSWVTLLKSMRSSTASIRWRK